MMHAQYIFKRSCKDYLRCVATYCRSFSQLCDVEPRCYDIGELRNADKPFVGRYCRTFSQCSNVGGAETKYPANQIEKALQYINNEYKIEGGRIELVTREYHEIALAFVQETFLRDEPINHSLGLTWSAEMEQWIMGYIQQNMSLMALAENTGDIIGLHITSRLHEPETSEDPAPAKDTKLQKLFALFKYLDQQSCFFEKYRDIKQYEIFAIAVSRNYRGLNIGNKLCRSTLYYLKALDKDQYVVRVTGTSRFSQAFIEKNGFSDIFSMDYKDYVVDGEEVVKNMDLHKKLVMYTLDQ